MRVRTWFQPWSSRPGWPCLRVVRLLPRAALSPPLRLDPTSEEAHFFLGLFYYTQNYFKLATSPFQTAQTLSPKSPLPVFYLAMTHEALGDATQALDLYREAENLSPEKSPQSASILVAHGRFLLSLGRIQDGVEKYRQAIERDPESREAHYELAKGFRPRGRFQRCRTRRRTVTCFCQRSTPAMPRFIFFWLNSIRS